MGPHLLQLVGDGRNMLGVSLRRYNEIERVDGLLLVTRMSLWARVRKLRGWPPRVAPAREAPSLWCSRSEALYILFRCLHV